MAIILKGKGMAKDGGTRFVVTRERLRVLRKSIEGSCGLTKSDLTKVVRGLGLEEGEEEK